jgi:hypothetical protein
LRAEIDALIRKGWACPNVSLHLRGANAQRRLNGRRFAPIPDEMESFLRAFMQSRGAILDGMFLFILAL